MSMLFSNFFKKFFQRRNFPGKAAAKPHKIREKGHRAKTPQPSYAVIGGISMDERLENFLEFCAVLALNFFVISLIRALCR